MLISSDSPTQTDAAQAQAERFVQSALDALAAHITILDHQGRIIGVNASWRQFADENGFTAVNHGIGLNYLKACDAAAQHDSQDARIMAAGIRDILKGRLTEFEMEYPCHSPVQRRWFVVRVSRFEWANEVRLIVAHQNVSELKRIQIELSESKHRIEAVLQNINNGILTVNSNGIVQTANQAAARIFGYELPDLLGLSIGQLLNEPSTTPNSFKNLNSEFGHELDGIRQDGTLFPIYFALSELRLNDGTLYTCIIQDITWRKRIEAEQREREKITVALEKERELRELKNRFISMMSHELRTPLASIRLSYDMLKKYGEISTPDEKLQALDNIHIQVEYLADMVTDVIALSRAESEGFSAFLSDTDLITYCLNIVEEYQFGHHRTHQVEFDCELTKLTAPIDKKLLRRALTNLLGNAIKYSPEGGRVVFQLTANAKWAIIRVRDSGIGIPPEDQSRLFEPFHRGSNASNISGTGLGLAVTKQAIELHRGKIDFETGEQGTTFVIYLPLERDEE